MYIVHVDICVCVLFKIMPCHHSPMGIPWDRYQHIMGISREHHGHFCWTLSHYPGISYPKTEIDLHVYLRDSWFFVGPIPTNRGVVWQLGTLKLEVLVISLSSLSRSKWPTFFQNPSPSLQTYPRELQKKWSWWLLHMVWLVVWTPLKNRKVNWDHEIPNIWENKKWQPNHQPVVCLNLVP